MNLLRLPPRNYLMINDFLVCSAKEKQQFTFFRQFLKFFYFLTAPKMINDAFSYDVGVIIRMKRGISLALKVNLIGCVGFKRSVTLY